VTKKELMMMHERIFCADFDEFEIDTLDYDSSICGFMLVLDKQPMKNKYKKVQEAAEEVRKEALDNARNQHHATCYNKVNLMLTMSDASSMLEVTSLHAVAKEGKKKKQKSMMDLKMYTGKDKFKGWSKEGKAFIVKMTSDIKEDVDSGVHNKWEKMYRKINELVKKSNEQEQEVKAAMR
jgi:hypothetical protein